MVSGHLQIKKGFYYVVLSYYDNRNKRHVKYVSTGLPEKGNKRKAEAELARIRSEFEPPQEVGELASDMPFAEYLLEWLDIVKVRVKATTFSSYEAMIKSTIEPYFRKKGKADIGVRIVVPSDICCRFPLRFLQAFPLVGGRCAVPSCCFFQLRRSLTLR